MNAWRAGPWRALALVAALAYAAPAGAAGEPLRGNDFNLELVYGPVLGPSRVTGLAGANVAQASQIDGCAISPAAAAVREGSSTSHVDGDFGLSLSLPGAYGDVDFFNAGPAASRTTRSTTSNFLAFSLGGSLQIGQLGLSIGGQSEQFTLSAPGNGKPGLDVTFGHTQAQIAYGFLRNQLVVGVGVRGLQASLDATREGLSTQLLALRGSAPTAGVVWKPDDRPFRLSAVVRAPVTARATEGDTSLFAASTAERDYVLPSRVVAPWEVEAGAAFQLGPRPLNPAFIDPAAAAADREAVIDARQRSRRAAGGLTPDEARREAFERAALESYARDDARLATTRNANHPRKYVLLLASVLVVGPVRDATNLVGLVEQARLPAGTIPTFSPRIGVEAEPIANLAKVRAGTYYEPARLAGVPGRQHFTLGGDLYLFRTPRLGFVPPLPLAAVGFIDVAPRFQNVGVLVGFWK